MFELLVNPGLFTMKMLTDAGKSFEACGFFLPKETSLLINSGSQASASWGQVLFAMIPGEGDFSEVDTERGAWHGSGVNCWGQKLL